MNFHDNCGKESISSWFSIIVTRRNSLFLIFSNAWPSALQISFLAERRWSLNIDHSRKRFCFPLFRSSASSEQHNTTHLQTIVAHIFSRHLPAASMRAKFRSSAVIISIFLRDEEGNFFFFLPSGKIRINDNKNECKKFRLCYGQVQTPTSPE